MSSDRPTSTAAKRRDPSLLFRLTVSAVLILVLALGLIGLTVDHAFRSAERAALWERLDSNLFVVLAGIEVNDPTALEWNGNLGDSLLGQSASGLYAGAFTSNASWLSPSTINAPVQPLTELRGLERGQELTIEADQDQDFFIFQLGLGWETPAGEIIDLNVWVAEDPARLEQAAGAFRGDLWRWLILAGLVILLAQLIMLSLPIQALRKVAAEVRNIESGKQQRLDGDYPREIKPLTDNLNALMETERANTEQYQSALGDLAHSLKTPLAVINAQLDELPSSNANSLRETVSQMQHRIRHELDRAARSGRRTMLASIPLEPVAQRMVDSLGKLYPEHTFELRCPADLSANVEQRDVIEVIGNLLENSAKYGAKATRLTLTSAAAGARRSGLTLEVDDDGPGLNAAEFEQMLQRGIRGDQRAEGQGLGLSIVERIVSSYQGTIAADDSVMGGLKIKVTLQPE